MLYTTDNLVVSLTMALATYLRANGYDVFWQASGDTDAQTAGLAQAKAIVTLVAEFPANPTYIVRLKSEQSGAEEIVVPALSLRATTMPKRIALLGLGHKEYWWEREIMIDGLAADDFQQRDLLDLLHDFQQSEEFKEFTIYDYKSDPTTPPQLDNPARVMSAGERGQELVHENPAVRYYLQGTMRVQYVE